MFVRFLETINKQNSNTSVNYRGFSIADIVICVLWLTWTSQSHNPLQVSKHGDRNVEMREFTVWPKNNKPLVRPIFRDVYLTL